jgi:acetyl-CoA synthetase
MTWYLEPDYETYEDASTLFEIDVPDNYNIAWDMLEKHPDPRSTVAAFQSYPDRRNETYTYRDIDVLSNKFGNALRDFGVSRGDRVAVMLPHKYQTLVAHNACWKIGAVSMPLTTQFGTSALGYRLRNSGAKALVFDESVRDTIEEVRDDCEDLDHLIQVDGNDGDDGVHSFDGTMVRASRHLSIQVRDADVPAVLLYTSGTTGDPKGVLNDHRGVGAATPGQYVTWGHDVTDEVVMWTPQDFGWVGGMAWLWNMGHFGRPLVLYPMGAFDIHKSFELMEEFSVTFTFLPPTGIRMMMDVDDPAEQYDLDLDVIGTGGEPVTPDIHRWIENEIGAVINEGFGQTETTTLIGECSTWFDPREGSMGRPAPGHDVAIVDSETGRAVPRGEHGEIAVPHDDPVVFTEYWKKPEKTAESRAGKWYLTGDLGWMDEDDYVYFVSRADDVIISSGYRIGPREVEGVLLEHEGVQQAAVIGIPDRKRGEIVKAIVEPAPVVDESAYDEIREELQDLVRDRLANYEYPREIEFMDELPKTTTRKVKRKTLRERQGIE